MSQKKVKQKKKEERPDMTIIYDEVTIQHDRCIRCGKRLKDPISKLLGYGPDCYRRYCNEKRRKLF